MRERVLAVLGAVALVVAALVARSFLTGSMSADGGSQSTTRPVVACTPDLQSVCDALVVDGLITAAPATLDLDEADEIPDEVVGWITWGPAPGMMNFDRPGTWSTGEGLASAPLGVLVAAGETTCAPPGEWSCVNQAVAAGLPVGVGPGTTAESLVRLHPAAAALVPTDGDFTTIAPGDLRQLVDSTQLPQADTRTQLTTFLTRRGALTMVVGPLPALRQASARSPGSVVSALTPTETATVVLAARTETAPDPGTFSARSMLTSKPATDALRELGLEPGSGAAAPDTTAGELYSVWETLS